MTTEYIFKYPGTKESFINALNQFSTSDGKFFYSEDYIIKLVDDEIHFGIERMGHSGGNWFVSKFNEKDKEIEFRGEIQYFGPSDSRTRIQKNFDKIGEFILFLLMLPLLIIIKLYLITEWCIRKLCRRPKSKPKSTEELLIDLMEKRLGCVRIV